MLYCLITLTSRIAQLVLTQAHEDPAQVRILSLNMRDLNVYVAR